MADDSELFSILTLRCQELLAGIRSYRRSWEWGLAELLERRADGPDQNARDTLELGLISAEATVAGMVADMAGAAWSPAARDNQCRKARSLRGQLAALRFSKRLDFARRVPFRQHRANIDRLVDQATEIRRLLDAMAPTVPDIFGALVLAREPQAWPRPPRSSAVRGASRVDIIVPVYRGMEETLSCLYSVLQAKTHIAYELLVIDDCGPEAELSARLATLAGCGCFTLLRNITNLGFVKTVNRGMAEHPNRDVLLLNSDTIVHDGWLDRLAATAAARPRVGTVTPLANTAGIFSYPRINLHNPLPADADSERLNTLAGQVNAGCTFPVPTGVGFCLYIRRECLRDVGSFDEVHFGLGYGEENDFCMRATKKGWLHLGTPAVFVYHAGNVSFGPAFRQRVRSGYHTLKRLHPEYSPLVKAHLRNNPGLEFLRRLDIARQNEANGARPAVLHVVGQSTGALRRHVDALGEYLWDDGVASLVVQPEGESPEKLVLINPRVDDTPNAVFEFGRDWEALLAALGGNRVHHVHYHDIPLWFSRLMELPTALNCSYDVAINQDVDGHDPKLPSDGEGRTFLRGARRIIVPLVPWASAVQTLGPFPKCLVRPYVFSLSPTVPPPPVAAVPQDVLRVVVLWDFPSDGRGDGSAAVMRSLIDDAVRRHPRLKFYAMGRAGLRSLRTKNQWEILPPMLPRHWNHQLAQVAPQLAVLLPTTLASADEMLAWCRGGVVVPVALDKSVAAIRLQALGWGAILPAQATATSINDALVAMPVPAVPKNLDQCRELFQQWTSATAYYDNLVLVR